MLSYTFLFSLFAVGLCLYVLGLYFMNIYFVAFGVVVSLIMAAIAFCNVDTYYAKYRYYRRYNSRSIA